MKRTAHEIIKSWAQRYPNCGYSPAQRAELANLYAADADSEGWTVAEFTAACSMAQRRCRFFPTFADIFAGHKEAEEQRRNTRPAPTRTLLAPPPMTDAYRERVRHMIKSIGQVARTGAAKEV